MAGTDAAKRKQIHYVDPLTDAFQPVYGGDTAAVPRAPAAKPRCEDIGFEHYWEYDNRLYLLACDPPQARQRTCRNCGKQEREIVVQKEVLEWRVAQDAEPTR